MITPYMDIAAINQIYDLYLDAEYRMLKKVSNRLANGIKGFGWAEKKAREVMALRVEIQQILQGTVNLSRVKMDEAMITAYKMGYNSANIDLGIKAVLLAEIRIPASVRQLMLELNVKTIMAGSTILRTTIDGYREIIAESSTKVLTGVETRLKATQEALNKFTDSGITSFVDKAGRRWEMATYAEMATRTATGRAAIQGHIDRQLEYGRDLVLISSHSGCPLCQPWDGQVLSISGNSMEYASLDDARGAGLFHPNCRHSMTGYVEGLTKREQPQEPDPEGYEKTQEQRYNERQIRKYKRRAEASLDDTELQLAQARIRDWQSRQRDLLKDSDLRRKYNRESITATR